jgi:hypothetical protein
VTPPATHPVVPPALLTRLAAEVEELDVDRHLAETVVDEAVERLHVAGPDEPEAEASDRVPLDAAVALAAALLEVLDEDPATTEQRSARLVEQSARLERAREEVARTAGQDQVSLRHTLRVLRERVRRRGRRA